MISLNVNHDNRKNPEKVQLANLFEELGDAVKAKSAELKLRNKSSGRPVIYPEFGKPELLKAPGLEITSDVRKNFNKLISEADEFCALPLQENGRRLSDKQIEDLREVVFSHRIFMSGGKDHDRARVEFDLTKNDIINRWEKKYRLNWPRYEHNVYSDGKIISMQGKKVSRHHFLPVRSVVVKEGSELEKLVDSGKVDFASPRLAKHYGINEHWNMIPSVHPQYHVGGIHNDDSVFSKCFGPIRLEYHYRQLDPKDDAHFENKVPKKYHILSLPNFATNFDYYLEKFEEKSGIQVSEIQKKNILPFIKEYVQSYPYREKTIQENGHEKTVREYVLKELDMHETVSNVKYANRLAHMSLKREWERYTELKWPQGARAEFLIPPFYKPKQYSWWMIVPGRAPRPTEIDVETYEEGMSVGNSGKFHLKTGRGKGNSHHQFQRVLRSLRRLHF